MNLLAGHNTGICEARREAAASSFEAAGLKIPR
jgi:hypothetical protein